MIIHISIANKYNPKHNYAKKMLYTSSMFGCNDTDYRRVKEEIENNPILKGKYIVWKESEGN